MRSPCTETVYVFLVERKVPAIVKTSITSPCNLARTPFEPYLPIAIDQVRSLIHNLTLKCNLSLVFPERYCNSFPPSECMNDDNRVLSYTEGLGLP